MPGSSRSDIAAILLAAGASSRMGPRNKLLLPWKGKALVRFCAERLRAAGACDVFVVLGHGGPEVERALTGARVRCIPNERFAEGMGSSIAAGVRAAGPRAGYLVALGDMPGVEARHYRAMLEAFDPGSADCIVASRWGDRRSSPVLFGSAYRPLLEALAGDGGARSILASHASRVIDVSVRSPSELADVDGPEDLE